MTKTGQTVFIVDDDPSFLQSLTRLLRAMRYNVESYPSAEDFLTQWPKEVSGCVITDLQMTRMDGIELQKALVKSQNPLPVIFLTGHGDIPTSVAAMRLGAEDFLQKTASKEIIIAAIERAMSRDIVERKQRCRQQELQSRFSTLTPREKEVLDHVVRGQLNKQTAGHMGIDERSVKRHRSHLMEKIQVKSVAELIQIVDELKLLNKQL